MSSSNKNNTMKKHVNVYRKEMISNY